MASVPPTAAKGVPAKPAPAKPAPPQTDAPTWTVVDLVMWKLVPQRLSGGRPYIQRYKDAWVRHNRQTIRKQARVYHLPPPLLAGVCWIEAGGDPTVIDSIAFAVRSFDWSGGDWIDRNMTVTSRPDKTSFGSGLQLRNAARLLGRDSSKMTSGELWTLAQLLERDVVNIALVAKHLRELADRDKLAAKIEAADEDAIRIVGARYNRGMGLSLEAIRRNTSYGDFIVKFWPRFEDLLK